jgi:hypothetical protein
MSIFLGAIGSSKKSLIRRIQTLIKSEKNLSFKTYTDRENKITGEVEKIVNFTEKDYDYMLGATGREILEFYIKKLK